MGRVGGGEDVVLVLVGLRGIGDAATGVQEGTRPCQARYLICRYVLNAS